MAKYFLYTSIEDLSQRSQNIINGLGGIDKLLEFYKTYQSFISIPKSGIYTNEQLCSFCEYLLTLNHVDTLGERGKLAKYFLYTSIGDLAKRSQNIINELGGIDKLLEFYETHQSFISVPKSGRYTNEQLCSFCEYLLTLKHLDTIGEGDKIEDKPKLEMYLALYENEKPFLSNRVSNILAKLELVNNFNASQENKVEYLKKYFVAKFDFMTINNIGMKSKYELESLRVKIKECNSLVTNGHPENFKIEIFQANSKVLSLILNDDEKDLFFINDKYSFKKLLCVFFHYTNFIKEKYRVIILNKYFLEVAFDKIKLSEQLTLSRERIRQIEIHLTELLLPTAIKLLRESIFYEADDLPDYKEKNFVVLEDWEHFTFRGTTFSPNKEFSKFVYEQVYTDFVMIDKLIKPFFKSFENPSITLIVSKDFIAKTNFLDLLDWADEQIYSFETISFEYRLETLIERFYHEQNQAIDKELLRILTIIILKIKKEVIELEIKTKIKLNNKAIKESIVNEIYIFLKEKDGGQSTKNILHYLSEKNIIIKKNDLLRILNSNRSTFTFLGMGNWNLKEWKKNDGQSGGNFRQIIRNLLLKNIEPMHISELHEYINRMKKVSINSLLSNLKLETDGTFIFFNCSYIGLSEKKYEVFWYRIPKYKAIYLNKHILLQKKEDILSRVKYLVAKYGYPEKHILFILEKLSSKYR